MRQLLTEGKTYRMLGLRAVIAAFSGTPNSKAHGLTITFRENADQFCCFDQLTVADTMNAIRRLLIGFHRSAALGKMLSTAACDGDALMPQGPSPISLNARLRREPNP